MELLSFYFPSFEKADFTIFALLSVAWLVSPLIFLLQIALLTKYQNVPTSTTLY